MCVGNFACMIRFTIGSSNMRFHSFLAVLVIALSSHVFAEAPVLEEGDRLAIIGDSITEQKLYSKYIETYLLACHPELQIQ